MQKKWGEGISQSLSVTGEAVAQVSVSGVGAVPSARTVNVGEGGLLQGALGLDGPGLNPLRPV